MYRKEFICSVIGFLFAIIGSILNMNIFSGGVLVISLLGVIYIYKKKLKGESIIADSVVKARIYEKFYSPIYAPEGKTVLFEKSSENTYRIFTKKGEYVLTIHSSAQGIGYEYKKVSDVDYFKEIS
ncbi:MULTISPECIES: hypothetical protein [Bacillus cereus group]|uniref:Uncharacterized protein n=1 Tax=Bacillus thuringiensis TaxID=1428 RepID=A0A9X6VCM3_BACTU|nr:MULTISPECIES: hypothetical protein [Bacillus cereus group]MEC3269849.1 hypothetical protein [Bacillus thuringiensis]PFB07918.1 hypothetical protein CN398_09280 [Bacillus thuringiensis]